MLFSDLFKDYSENISNLKKKSSKNVNINVWDKSTLNRFYYFRGHFYVSKHVCITIKNRYLM